MGDRWIWKDASRQEWSHAAQPDTPYDSYALGIGCLQRIAESLEVLVERSDPVHIKNEAIESKWRERWQMFAPFVDEVVVSEKRALARLFGDRKVSSSIKDDVHGVLDDGEPVWPYHYFPDDVPIDDVPIDPVVAGRWRDETVAYWDGLSELPLRVSKDGTKKQARYREWLSSLNGQVVEVSGNGAPS